MSLGQGLLFYFGFMLVAVVIAAVRAKRAYDRAAARLGPEKTEIAKRIAKYALIRFLGS